MGSKRKASNEGSAYRVQSVYDGLRLLEYVADCPQPVTSSDVARALDEPRNRVYRILQTLQEAGYVVQDENSRAYRPTLRLVTLGNSILRKHDLEGVCKPILERLRDQCGETVYLTARDGDEAVGLLTVESTRLVRISSQPGKRWGLGRGANGQALVIGMAESERQDFMERHPELAARMAKATSIYRDKGVVYVDGAIDDIEDAHVRAIGAPLSTTIAGFGLALAIAWPISRDDADFDEFRNSLLTTATELETILNGSRSPSMERRDRIERQVLVSGDADE